MALKYEVTNTHMVGEVT